MLIYRTTKKTLKVKYKLNSPWGVGGILYKKYCIAFIFLSLWNKFQYNHT